MHDLGSYLKPFAERSLFSPPPPRLDQISIVIPVKNNQVGIDNFLDSFLATHDENLFPIEIIIVDNRSIPPIRIRDKFRDAFAALSLERCDTPGAAAARNTGVAAAKGEWILFTDSDCIATESFVSGYLDLTGGCVAYSGSVKAFGDTLFDKYYDTQTILVPPRAKYGTLSGVPQYIVTANAIVHKEAYMNVGGFTEHYPCAGGEDEDFSAKLWQVGNISYAYDSVIRHDFMNGVRGFYKRFFNYGKGAFITEKIWRKKKRPHFFWPNHPSPTNILLSLLHAVFMKIGYYRERLLNEVK